MRTPTVPVPPLTPGAIAGGAAKQQRQRTGPEPRRQPARELRHYTQTIGNLIGIGRNQRQRPLGGPALDGEYTRDSVGPERIGTQTVQRIRRQGNHASVANHANRIVQPAAAEAAGVNDDPAHDASARRTQCVHHKEPKKDKGLIPYFLEVHCVLCGDESGGNV